MAGVEVASRFEGSARQLRRNWVLPATGALLAAASVAALASDRPEGIFGIATLLVGVTLAVASLVRGSYPLSTPVGVLVQDGALSVGAERAVTAADVADARLLPRAGRHGDTIVSLRLRDRRTLSLWLWEADARRLLEALGVRLGERRATFPLAIPATRRFGLAFLVVGLPYILLQTSDLARLGVLVAVTIVALVFTTLLSWALALVRGSLVVAADGLTTRWIRQRFVPFSDVIDLRTRSDGVDVRLRSGRTLRLRSPDAPDDERQRGAEARAMITHLVAAREQFVARPREAPPLRAVLARNGRDPRAWLDAIDELASGGGHRYRIAPPEPEHLVAVARDPETAVDRRLAAAAALARMGPERRDAVRSVADCCAREDLRRALCALADAETEAAMIEALASSEQLEAEA